MTAIAFAAPLTGDGSLTVPKEMVAELGLHPGDVVQVHIETTQTIDAQEAEMQEQTPLERAIYEMTHRTPEQLAQAQQRAMERYQPRRTPPPGKTLADMVSGKWPGDETEEQLQQALAELS